jgi:hypothetical protein
MNTPTHVLQRRAELRISALNDIVQAECTTPELLRQFARTHSTLDVLAIADLNGVDAEGMSHGQALKALIAAMF